MVGLNLNRTIFAFEVDEVDMNYFDTFGQKNKQDTKYRGKFNIKPTHPNAFAVAL